MTLLEGLCLTEATERKDRVHSNEKLITVEVYKCKIMIWNLLYLLYLNQVGDFF